MSRKYLLWASLVITIVVVIQELFWLGRSSLAWIVLLLAVAIGLQAIYTLIKKWEACMKVEVFIHSRELPFYNGGLMQWDS